jgi:hypothetical protein
MNALELLGQHPNLTLAVLSVYAVAASIILSIAAASAGRSRIVDSEPDAPAVPLEPGVDDVDQHFETLPCGVAGPAREPTSDPEPGGLGDDGIPPLVVSGPPTGRGRQPVHGLHVVYERHCSLCRDQGTPSGCRWCDLRTDGTTSEPEEPAAAAGDETPATPQPAPAAEADELGAAR